MTAATIDDSVRHWNVKWRAPELLDEIDIVGRQSFDLHSENGVRVALNDTEAGSQTLIVVIHHACLDALGGLQLSMWSARTTPINWARIMSIACWMSSREFCWTAPMNKNGIDYSLSCLP